MSSSGQHVEQPELPCMLVKMQNATATLENRVAISYEVKPSFLILPSNPTP